MGNAKIPSCPVRLFGYYPRLGYEKRYRHYDCDYLGILRGGGVCCFETPPIVRGFFVMIYRERTYE
jgi:hypothetical protein